MTEMHPANAVDVTNCEREPIHLSGAVQPFGFLLALADDETVVQASANAGDMLGLGEGTVFGRPLAEILGDAAAESVRAASRAPAASSAPLRLFGTVLPPSGAAFDLAVHVTGGHVVIEAEPAVASPHPGDPLATVRRILAELGLASTTEAFGAELARQVRDLTGFERVMVYRFLPDDSGEVVAEAFAPGLEPWLGQRYPASDIPRQARELYRRNWLRLIADAGYRPVPLIAAPGVVPAPLDLSLSQLRSVSPIHLEYLGNMGVTASMSISIMRGGRLWGLVACHHAEPRYLPPALRLAAELVGQAASLLLVEIEGRETRERERAGLAAIDQLRAAMRPDLPLVEALAGQLPTIAQILAVDGAGLWARDEFRGFGSTPPERTIEGLAAHLAKVAPAEVVATDALGGAFPAAVEYAADAAGLVSVPLPGEPGGFLFLFRRELIRAITWAGDPNKPLANIPGGGRISPRTSFEAWTETVRGRSMPWSEAELGIARGLRGALVELALQRAQAGPEDQAGQAVLVAELDHRVRNILSLILSLVGHTAASAASLPQFVEVIERRIQALARAHGGIAAGEQAPVLLSRLIEAETAAHLGGAGGGRRVAVAGQPVVLRPRAVSSVSMVLHELVANAESHGALSSENGRVEIVWGFRYDGSLEIRWIESGGPTISEPSRRGFGLSLIERLIPFELQGESEVEFRPSGFRARLLLPERQLAGIAEEAGGAKTVVADADGNEKALEGGRRRALLVEDNMIIALDAEQMLLEIGFDTVDLASTMEDARKLMGASQPSVAILDLNLGRESSVPLAEDLQARGVPVVFATGYGHSMRLPDTIRDPIVVNKPYLAHMLKDAITRAIERM